MSKKTSKIIEDFIIENYHKLSRKELIEQTGVSNNVIRRIISNSDVTSKSAKKYEINEKYFEKIDNEEKAYWLGFLYADGYVRKRIDKGGELRLKLKIDDKYHIELFKKCLNSTHTIKDIKSIVIISGITHTSYCSTFSVYNNKIVNDLFNIGCVNNKTFKIKFPKLNKKLVRHFIRGYFDGDGTICLDKNNNSKFNFTSGSISFLEDLQKFFIEIKLKKNKIYHYKTYSRLCWSSMNDLNKIYNYLYNNSNIYLNRKKEMFNKIILINDGKISK